MERAIARLGEATGLRFQTGQDRCLRRPSSTLASRLPEPNWRFAMCEARSRRVSTESLSEAVLEAFAAEPPIDFAYKTSRIFRQTEEGKAALRTEPRSEEE